MRRKRRADRPARIVTSDRSAARLDELARIHRETPSDCALDYVPADGIADNDAVLKTLRPGSLVVNATGLGKDAPGSPLSDRAVFPEGGICWELNYRGDLVFLDQARRQQAERGLTLVDGWTYFLHGWTRVIAEVFDIDIPTSGPAFERLSEVAREAPGPQR